MLGPTSRTDKRSKKALKMSLINNAAETTAASSPKSKSSQNEFQINPLDNNIPNPTDDLHQQSITPTTSKPYISTEFKCTLSSPYIECIAPNQKGNFITSICIDELNGWLLSGQCSGTLNAWKIPTLYNNKNNKNNKIYECRNLMQCEEDGIRHIYAFENNIICMVGYRRICSFINYDKSTICHWKLGINDIFTYSPFTSPHMFYSTQYENIVHIFCRSFSNALKIDLKTHKKEVLQLTQHNKIPLKTNILTVNKNFIIWHTLKTKYNFYIKPENICKNKQKKTANNLNGNNNNNKVFKWFNTYTNKAKRKYLQPTLIKIEIRSLSNFNPIHDIDYFKPFTFNSWGFMMDNISTNIAYITQLNVIKIIKIIPDLNIMQYGIDYNKNEYLNKYKIQIQIQQQRNNKKNKKNNKKKNSFADALTLSTGGSYDGSIETQSNERQTVDILQNEMDDDMNINNNIEINDNNDDNEYKQPMELSTLKGHNGHILAMQYMDGVVVSMATDKKLNVWNGKTGKRIASVSNIPGRFIPGYPYIIKKSKNSNKVFYTADDGIFMVVF